MLLSFIMTGRNDDYCGNFVKRMELAINYLGWSATSLGLQNTFELLLVDWNSDTPLSDALSLSDEALSFTQFIRVPPELASLHHTNPSQTFHTAKAVNVGLRRAVSDYPFIVTADAIVSQSTLLSLCNILSGKYHLPYNLDQLLFKVSRKMIPYQITEYEPCDIMSLDKYLAECSSALYVGSNPRITAGLGGIGASRELWHVTRGVTETFGYYGFSDIELAMRIEQHYFGLELSHYGVMLYDLEQEQSIYNAHRSKLVNPHIYTDKLSPNTSQWGLADEPGIMDIPASDYVFSPQYSPSVGANGTVSKLRSFESFMRIACANELIDLDAEFMGWLYDLLDSSNPRYVAEFGISDHSLAIASVMANNTLDVFFLADWRGNYPDDNQDCLTPARIGKILKDLYHRGRCGYFVGDPPGSISLYVEKWGKSVDFAFIQFDILAKDTAQAILRHSVDMLTDSGLILLFSKTGIPDHEVYSLTKEFECTHRFKSSDTTYAVVLSRTATS